MEDFVRQLEGTIQEILDAFARWLDDEGYLRGDMDRWEVADLAKDFLESRARGTNAW